MKIGLCGSISVGKTTLVKELSKLPEFAHYHFATERSKYLRDLGIPLNTDSTLSGQLLFLSERSFELMHPNLITDRTIIDVMAFTNSAQSITDLEKYDYNQLASHLIPEYDWIFYVSPAGVDIEDNSVRCIDAGYRQIIDLSIRNIISENLSKIKNHAVISGPVEDRIKQIKFYLNC